MISKPIIAFILLYLYFMIPKVDLFLIPGTVTGIRIQDFISLALFLILFDFRIHKYTLFVLIFMFIHLVYSILAWGSITSILGFLRLIEYYFVAKGIVYVIEKGHWKNFLNYVLFSIAIFAFGQYQSIFPNIDPGRGIIYSTQFSGPFGTPAELTYFLIVILYLSYLVDRVNIAKLAASTLVLFNGVKAGILGFVVLFAQRIRSISLSTIILFIIVFFGIMLILDDYVFLVLQFLQGISNGALLLSQNQDIYINITELSGVTERSLVLRVEKWSIALAALYQNPLALMFGFGVYSYTFAMDGGIMKFLFEFGIISFAFLLYVLSKLSLSFIFIVMATSILFDSYTSSVIMPILISTFLILRKNKNYINNEK